MGLSGVYIIEKNKQERSKESIQAIVRCMLCKALTDISEIAKS